MLPNVLPSPSPDAHVPVLASEVARAPRRAPGRPDRRLHLRRRRAFAALLARGPRGQRRARRDRPRPDDAALRRRVARDGAARACRCRPMHGPFATLPRGACSSEGAAGRTPCLIDLGMSSMQVDAPARGFSYMHDAPLDMRMDPSDEVTAAATRQRVGASGARADLPPLRRGALLAARSPARSCDERARSARSRARSQLVATDQAAPSRRPSRFGHGHPAKRVFQALRIAVNDELGQLEDGLEARSRCASPAAGWP